MISGSGWERGRAEQRGQSREGRAERAETEKEKESGVKVGSQGWEPGSGDGEGLDEDGGWRIGGLEGGRKDG